MTETTPALSRHLGRAALAGVLVFALVVLAAQFVRTDLDWLHTPLSFYLLDPHGLWVQGAYFALAAAMVLLGCGWYRALQPGARSAAPLLLFVCAGVALAVTAVAETGRRGDPITLESLVHGLAAQAAFLCVTVAMLLQAWRLRGDVRWRHRFAVAFGLAAIAFAGVWVLALWRDAPRGLLQKAEIAAILLWLGMAANWLRAGAAGPIHVQAGKSRLEVP
ncbi:DUF998 domain-containing protein [Marilutibacter alkalisoli]|uniref:DUF998 domain-containing protein n=1 Tax=Marilutibacter alkalisoli TaxID=2591633 RepID=A0A514BTD1_9GAMM|nr:DUF998 domain-containing protein [Lysobacter alkalisoli]QDH70299.1 DUF998 domain-containing protein [Lysobacter alkalisoli]